MSDAIWDDPTVTAYILGELSTEEAEAFERKMQADSTLAEVVAEARNVTEQLQIMYEEEASTTLDPKRRDAITAGNSVSSPATQRSTQWRIPLTLLATAAALLLLLGSPYLVTPDRTVLSEPEAPSTTDSRVSGKDLGDVATDSEMLIEAEGDEDLAPLPVAANADSGGIELNSIPMESFEESADIVQMDELVDRDVIAGFGAGSAAPRNAAEKKIASGPGNSVGQQKLKAMLKRQENLSLKQSAASSLPSAPGASLPSAPGASAAPEGNAAPAPAAKPGESRRSRRIQADKTEMPFEADSLHSSNPVQTEDPAGEQNRFQNLTENAFKRVADAPLSTFSVDVDTASYSKVREYLLRQRRLPPVDAVRIEELVNYFDYEYLPPKDSAETPFAAKAEIMACPWNEDHRLARIALKGKTMQPKNRPLSNLVFLLDTSGSMNSPNKLPLVKAGMNMLLSQLGENDRVAIVVYAGSAGLVLDSTPATKTRKIEKALNTLAAGGSTNGGQGIQLAYQTARDNFIDGGVNRVILCTDGDFNVGTTGTGSLVRMVEQEAAGNIFLSVLGFGMGNHNDSMLEQISGIGNGNYAFIDSQKEAQKVLVDQVSGTLVTIAKDVKLQIEFNPRMISAYRLIGYENRVLAKEDFNNDKKDAGEIGAGHAVTALYELIPAGGQEGSIPPKVDNLKYQKPNQLTDAANGGESLTLKLRYKQPDGDTSELVEFPVTDNETRFEDADHDARFAAAVASFGMQLRGSEYAGNWEMKNVIDVARDAMGEDMSGLRAEFIEMAEAAKKMKP